MKIQALIVTCPDRADVLQTTLASLNATDWNAPPKIQMDVSAHGDRRERQTENVRRGLDWFSSSSDSEFLLLLEDDLEFNRHLRWNLERWSPLLNGRMHFGSLYNPNIRSRSRDLDYFIADPAACYGSQAYLLSHSLVAVALSGWPTVTGMQDIKITRLADAAGHSLHYHQPSLVQHIGIQSMWGGGFHQAGDFDGDWKSVFSYDKIPGWFTFPRLYERAISEAQDGDTVVEIGAWLGRSTAFLGRAIQTSGKVIRAVVVDTFEGSPAEPHMLSSVNAAGGSIRSLFERNMALAGLGAVFEVRQVASVEAARSIPDQSCSFVFIDADHRYQAVRDDIRAWRGKVRSGGILAGHDCHTYAEVYAAVRDEIGTAFITTDENVWIHTVV